MAPLGPIVATSVTLILAGGWGGVDLVAEADNSGGSFLENGAEWIWLLKLMSMMIVSVN